MTFVSAVPWNTQDEPVERTEEVVPSGPVALIGAWKRTPAGSVALETTISPSLASVSPQAVLGLRGRRARSSTEATDQAAELCLCGSSFRALLEF